MTISFSVHPTTLLRLGSELSRHGAAVFDHSLVDPPDTGRTRGLTQASLERVTQDAAHLGWSIETLGARVAEFVHDAVAADDRAGSTLHGIAHGRGR